MRFTLENCYKKGNTQKIFNLSKKKKENSLAIKKNFKISFSLFFCRDKDNFLYKKIYAIQNFLISPPPSLSEAEEQPLCFCCTPNFVRFHSHQPLSEVIANRENYSIYFFFFFKKKIRLGKFNEPSFLFDVRNKSKKVQKKRKSFHNLTGLKRLKLQQKFWHLNL